MSSVYPAFIIFEITTYILFITCFINAWRKGFNFVTELFGALLFGLILEYINANSLADYHYGQFLVMIKNIPLCVGIGWAIIIYSSMLLSDNLGFSLWTRPVVDALLALNIDISMDIIAIRLGSGMWVWGWADQRLRWTSEWFGVPFGNFFGWFFVVLLYSGLIRIGRQFTYKYKWNFKWKLSYPFICVVISEILLMGLILIFTYFWSKGIPSWILLVIPLIPAVISLLIWGKPKPVYSTDEWIIHIVPMTFHLFFLISLFTFKIIAWTPWILPISISMLITGLAVHMFALLSRKKIMILRHSAGKDVLFTQKTLEYTNTK